MKIALLSPFYPYRGGIAQFSDRLYQELKKENEVKAFSYSTLYPKVLFPGKSQFVPNPVDHPDLPSERILSTIGFSSYSKTADAINDFAPDVLLVAYWMPYIAIALNKVCRKLDKNIKIVGLVHNATPHEKSWFGKCLANLFFKRCHAFVTMSEHVKEDLVKMGYKAPALALEHPIYDQYPALIDQPAARQELNLAADKKTLLFFGLIRSYKGLDILIEAMGLLDDSYQLIIAGESYSPFTSYQQLIDLSKNKANIKVWEQYIPDEMVSTLFSAADVLVLPYRSATQSGVVAIAYQLGIPMIATNVGGLGATISDSQTGIVVPEVSASALAEGVKQFFEKDPSSFAENLTKEKARLSWSNFAKEIRYFLEK